MEDGLFNKFRGSSTAIWSRGHALEVRAALREPGVRRSGYIDSTGGVRKWDVLGASSGQFQSRLAQALEDVFDVGGV
jgi:hypothetical protein